MNAISIYYCRPLMLDFFRLSVEFYARTSQGLYVYRKSRGCVYGQSGIRTCDTDVRALQYIAKVVCSHFSFIYFGCLYVLYSDVLNNTNDVHSTIFPSA